jgi:hypothetical protein
MRSPLVTASQSTGDDISDATACQIRSHEARQIAAELEAPYRFPHRFLRLLRIGAPSQTMQNPSQVAPAAQPPRTSVG